MEKIAALTSFNIGCQFMINGDVCSTFPEISVWDRMYTHGDQINYFLKKFPI